MEFAPSQQMSATARSVVSHPFEGRPHRTILAMSLPVMLSLVAEPLAGVVDTAFVERLGVAHAAALGAATALLSGFIWIFNFLGVGTQTEVAYMLGERRQTEARHVASLALLLAIVLGAAAAVAAWLLLDVAASWMSGDAAVRLETRAYLEVRLLGLPAALALFSAFGALRGLQDMRTPLWIAAAMSAANIGLDAVLVFGWGPIPALGIVGAAWATVASQVAAAIWATVAVVRRLGLARSFELGRARALFRVGRDMMLRTSALMLFLLLCTRVALQMGAGAGAANQAIRQMWMLIAFMLDAYAATAQSLVAYFLGADRIDLARKVARVSVGWGLVTGTALAGLLLMAESGVARLLVPAAASASFSSAWPVFALAQPLNAVAFVTDGIHWGSKDYAYLRNGMLASGLLGLLLVLAIDPAQSGSLARVWGAIAVWIALRAAFGWARIWPGIGRAPLAARAGGLEGRSGAGRG